MAKNKKIWIADDDESIRFVLESGLSEAGFNEIGRASCRERV